MTRSWTGVMFQNPLMRAVSRATRVVPVDVGRKVLVSLAFAVSALRKDSNLVWFAEGAISDDGELNPFQPGIGLVLVTACMPVLPAKIEGTREALPRGKWWPRRRPICVTFGEAIDTGKFLANRGDEGYRELVAALNERVVELASDY